MTESAPPARSIVSPDGTPIAVFSSGDGPPLVLVHGATADHTTWRSVGPVLARAFAIHAVDRRGRGASGDAPDYAIEREYEDLAAVADAIAGEAGTPVDVVGHSYGGRIALGASLLTGRHRPARRSTRVPRVRRVTSAATGRRASSGGSRPRSPPGIATPRSRRSCGRSSGCRRPTSRRSGPTRSGRSGRRPSARRSGSSKARPRRRRRSRRSPASACRCSSCSAATARAPFRDATEALDARLRNGRVEVIAGARHAAHHTHVEAFVRAVTSFLGPADVAD